MSAEDLQRDEQWAATAESAAAAAVDAKLVDVHTCFPGIVKSFDRAKMTVTVQPALKRLWREQGHVDLPLCVDVPVVFPGGGGGHLVFDVSAGDECVMHVSERAIDFWYARGGVQETSDHRLFDLSDCFAAVGVCSAPRAAACAPVPAGGCELRSDDGATVFRIEGGTAYAGGKVGANPIMVLTPDVIAWLAAVGTGSGAGPCPTDIGATKAKAL